MSMRDDGEGRDARASGDQKNGSVFGRLWRGTKWLAASPFEAFQKDEIVENARLIGALGAARKGGSPANGRFRVHLDRSFDLAATAFLHGVSVPQLETLLRRRQKETARTAYLAFGLGTLCFIGWLLRAWLVPWTGSSLVQALEFLPFCLFFFLMAFKSALENFQLRTRRLATASEYLRTEERFWPR